MPEEIGCDDIRLNFGICFFSTVKVWKFSAYIAIQT